MTHRIRPSCVLLVLLLQFLAVTVRAADAPVRASQNGNSLTLDNGLVSVTLDAAAGTLSASAAGTRFIEDARLGEGDAPAAFVGRDTELGRGKAIELTRPTGAIDRIVLYPGSPFVVLRQRLRNATDEEQVIDRLTPVALPLRAGKPLADLRVLGCDGLTPADRSRASYAFLAAADPATRAGVVAGWITSDRASGIVLAKPAGEHVTITARSEYGKLRLAPGESTDGETFVVGHFDDALLGLEAYADTVARQYHVKLKPIPSGYCTWYSRPHGGAADEKSLKELATFAKEKLGPFGFNVVQIDDKWQVANRDFTAHKPNGPYPSGMKRTADTLHELGMTPGLWFIPFGWDPKRPAFAEHQDYFVKRPDGSPYEVKWAGTCLDMTHPGARELLRQTVSRVVHDWGFKYLKLDGLWTGMAVQILYPNPAVRDDKLGDATFHDPRKTNVEAYRDGLKLVRQAAGDDVFVTGCNVAQNMRTLAGSFGLVDALRVGRDIGASWDKILPSMTMGTRLYFFHGRVWHNDPDCLMLRAPLTLDQARAWASWIAISGQLNLVSEWLPGLPEDRLDVVRRSMPNTGLCGRPVDLFERDQPRLWKLTAGSGENRRDVLGLFNWDAKELARITVPLNKLGLPDRGAGGYVGFDYWHNEFVGPVTGALAIELPPASCRVIALRPAADRPQVISTSRHITQGVIDLADEKWDPATRTLSGTSKVVANDPYQLRIVAPGRVTAVNVSPDDRQGGVTTQIDDAGPNARVTLSAPTKRDVRWRVTFSSAAP